jgi:hypothetical protein
VIVLIAAMLAVSLESAFGQQADPRRDPATALKEGVRLLEGKHYTEFVRKCILPEEQEGAISRFGSIENAVRELDRSGWFVLALKAFRAAMMAQPTFNDDGTRANYAFEAPINGERRLQLRKIDGLWYFAD